MDVIINSYPYFNGGLVKLPFTLGYRWIIISQMGLSMYIYIYIYFRQLILFELC